MQELLCRALWEQRPLVFVLELAECERMLKCGHYSARLAVQVAEPIAMSAATLQVVRQAALERRMVVIPLQPQAAPPTEVGAAARALGLGC